jgi:hypothetical protein
MKSLSWCASPVGRFLAVIIVLPVALPICGADPASGTDTSQWFRDALRPDVSPVDASFLNLHERHAGRRGFLSTEGDRLVFADGSETRFWGANIAAHAIFADKEHIKQHARRLADLGFNLVRIHHHDSTGWVRPTVIDQSREDSRQLDPAALDRLDWWIRCLKDEGIYVWLDLHVGRQFKAGDGITLGFDEIARKKGEGKGFNYFNPRLRELMQEFNARYLEHVNAYTGLSYKDDPVLVGLLVSNENDLTHHFGNLMLADKGNPVHHGLFQGAAEAFARKSGLPVGGVGRTWEAGPAKVFLNDVEWRFHRSMVDHLKSLHVRVPVATTDYWGNDGLWSVPALTAGDVIDVHSYGKEGALRVNPREQANFIHWIGAAQVHDKPLTVTEWNVEYPAGDRFLAPMYVAAIASLQGWDAPMIYNYSQRAFTTPQRVDKWSTYNDPALAGLMPAAAIAFRQGHLQRARETHCLQLNRQQLYFTHLDPAKSATIRTLIEQHRFTLGLPDIPELEWDEATKLPPGVKVVTDPHQDFIPPGQSFVRSDTGEITRHWQEGWLTIDTPGTQSAGGRIGGRKLALRDLTVEADTPQAVLVLNSLTDQPVGSSPRLLLTAMARVLPSPGERMPWLSEPVRGTVRLKSNVAGLRLVPLAPDGQELAPVELRREAGTYTIQFPAPRGTHWFLVK